MTAATKLIIWIDRAQALSRERQDSSEVGTSAGGGCFAGFVLAVFAAAALG